MEEHAILLEKVVIPGEGIIIIVILAMYCNTWEVLQYSSKTINCTIMGTSLREIVKGITMI